MILLPLTALAQAAPGTFICNQTLYLTQGSGIIPTNLFAINTTSNPFTFANVGANSGFQINAIGYNTVDNFIYGMITRNSTGSPNSTDGNLARVSNDGSVTNLGAITGLPVADYIAGDFDTSGTYYVKAPGNNATIHIINVSTVSRTSVLTLSQSVTLLDFSFVPVQNLFYGM